MKNLDNDFTTIFTYKGKVYVYSYDNEFKIGDIFFDWRSNVYREIENEEDIKMMSFVAPECYTILKEV